MRLEHSMHYMYTSDILSLRRQIYLRLCTLLLLQMARDAAPHPPSGAKEQEGGKKKYKYIPTVKKETCQCKCVNPLELFFGVTSSRGLSVCRLAEKKLTDLYARMAREVVLHAMPCIYANAGAVRQTCSSGPATSPSSFFQMTRASKITTLH